MPHLQRLEPYLPPSWARHPIRLARRLWRRCTQLSRSPKFQRYVSLCGITLVERRSEHVQRMTAFGCKRSVIPPKMRSNSEFVAAAAALCGFGYSGSRRT
ncbi:uncharacterized protein LOC117592073 [Drosophila guanche]|uniref:uncharacterized protein LOC117592073 n=1 Tax=Drosophila guanche TaxID=7266 RepID=UPI001471F072|nr:uncharacterized protein LOC117592073 [Drosophila guanche]